MKDTFPILEVTSGMRTDVEQLGSKPKFWFKWQGERWLYKRARPETGEDWSEKVASEIAVLLGLPTHRVELAVWEGNNGCAVKSFLTPEGNVLVHGNELLGGVTATMRTGEWCWNADRSWFGRHIRQAGAGGATAWANRSRRWSGFCDSCSSRQFW